MALFPAHAVENPTMTPIDHRFYDKPVAREMASAVPREDARWIRPTFRPPPLNIVPTPSELPYLGTIQRMDPRPSADSASAR